MSSGLASHSLAERPAERHGAVEPDERYTISIRLLERPDASAAAPLALCAVDGHPGSIVPLPRSITALLEGKHHGHEQRKRAEVFHNIEESPAAERPGGPFQTPFDLYEWEKPWRAMLSSTFDPRCRATGLD